MANAYFYSNTAQQTTLSGSISSSSTSIQVAATTGFPASTPYILALDYGASAEELVSVTGVAGTTLTVTRAFSGTSAQSHSLGAVVRHVVNAQDLTDFRTHEGSTNAVHGVSGTLVGTSDTQTLANKTLTAPTINGATFSGTLAGSPTFSGNPVYSGYQQSTQSAATNVAEAGTVTGDTFDRYRVYADGKLEWGPGNAARDVNLYRSAANTLKTDYSLSVVGQLFLTDLLRNSRATATDSAYETRVSGDADARWFTEASGKHWWGSGAAVCDTYLYRDSVNSLSTGGDFVIGGELSVAGTTTWTSYTPTWSNQGTAAFSTNTGWYYKIGKLVFFTIYASVSTAGSGSTTPVMVTLPSSPDRSTRQTFTLSAETVSVNGGLGATTIRNGAATCLTSGTGATIDRLRVTDSDGDGDNNLYGVDLKLNGLITIQGWYREA